MSMLARTADNLFWMARYMERAENTARMLDVTYQTSLLPQPPGRAEAGWRSLLDISELGGDFARRHGQEVGAEGVMRFMVSDEANPSSILCCLRAVRENARAARSALTTEVWENENLTWLGFCTLLEDGTLAREPAAVFEYVKFRSHLSRGVRLGTMLKDESLFCLRAGTFLERADNTARLLGARLDGPGDDDVHYWSAVLRAVAAFEIYRKVYRDVVRPQQIAELLILHPDMPRALRSCIDELATQLTRLGGGCDGATMADLALLQQELRCARIEELVDAGLGDWLERFLQRVAGIGEGIAREYLAPTAASVPAMAQ